MCSQTVHFQGDEGSCIHDKTVNLASTTRTFSTDGRSMKDDSLLHVNSIGLAIIISTVALLINLANWPSIFNADDAPATRYLYFFIIGYACGHPRSPLAMLRPGLQMAYTRTKKAIISLPQGPLKRSLSSAQALSRLSRASSTDTIRKLSTTIRKSFRSYRRRAALKAITRKESFAKLDAIKKLSIHDLVILFRYATDVNQVNFDKKRFMTDNSKLIRSMVTAMDMAEKISRGGQARRNKLQSQRKHGDVDALYFLATMRLFAEWRVQRLVLEGYNRYSVGLNLAYRDVMQNLSKIEDSVHIYLKHKQKQLDEGTMDIEITSPTLRELLQFEEHAGLHPSLPRLKEKSAGSGLLWTKRQLHYQTSLLSNLLDVPTKFPTTEDAAVAAYMEAYDKYHGWAIKKVFTHSFGGTPPIYLFWSQMCPPVGDINDMLNDGDCISSKLSDISEGSENLDNEFLAAIENFGKEVTKRWEDFFRSFNCVDDDDDDDGDRSRDLIISSESYLKMGGALGTQEQESLNELSIGCDESTNSIILDPVDDVKSGALELVKELQPLLTDIMCLIDELNMNDPSKV